MGIMGTAQGGKILLDEPLPLPDGTRVHVDVSPVALRKGSPASVLGLAGTLSDEEADTILKAVQECRRVDPALWNGRG